MRPTKTHSRKALIRKIQRDIGCIPLAEVPTRVLEGVVIPELVKKEETLERLRLVLSDPQMDSVWIWVGKWAKRNDPVLMAHLFVGSPLNENILVQYRSNYKDSFEDVTREIDKLQKSLLKIKRWYREQNRFSPLLSESHETLGSLKKWTEEEQQYYKTEWFNSRRLIGKINSRNAEVVYYIKNLACAIIDEFAKQPKGLAPVVSKLTYVIFGNDSGKDIDSVRKQLNSIELALEKLTAL